MPLEEWIKLKLQEHRINCFYYFCHLNNIENVIKHGILSRNESLRRNLISIDIADQEVLERRSGKLALFSNNVSRDICDAVPVYLIPKTPTFYKHWQTGEYENIVFILIKSFILTRVDEINYTFTDGNAASICTNFYYSLNKLDEIPWGVLHSKTIDLNLQDKDIVRKRCSEFLIYPSISIEYFWKFEVYDENIKQTIEKILSKEKKNIPVEIKQSLYCF